MALRSKSAMKRVKTSEKRRARNLAVRRAVRIAFKQAERAIAGKSGEAKKLASEASSIMDKAVERGIIHRNRAARQKSRLVKKLNKIKG